MGCNGKLFDSWCCSKRVLWPLKYRVMCTCSQWHPGDNSVLYILREWAGYYCAHTCWEERWLWNTSLNCLLAACICIITFLRMTSGETWLRVAGGTGIKGWGSFKFLCIESMYLGGVFVKCLLEGNGGGTQVTALVFLSFSACCYDR